MIYNKYLDNDIDEKIGSVFSTVKKIVSFKNIIFILFALLLSTKTFIGDFRPFNYVMLAVASAFEVPLILVLVASIIGLAAESSIAIVSIIIILSSLVYTNPFFKLIITFIPVTATRYIIADATI